MAIFPLWSLWFEPILENVREGKALKENLLEDLQLSPYLFRKLNEIYPVSYTHLTLPTKLEV